MKFEPNMEYRVTSIEHDSIEDVWSEGQVGDFNSMTCDWIQIEPTDNITDMVDAIRESFWGDTSVDVYENQIRVDYLADDRDGSEASKAEVEAWMKGEMKLFNYSYTFYVEKVILDAEPDLQEILAEEQQQ